MTKSSSDDPDIAHAVSGPSGRRLSRLSRRPPAREQDRHRELAEIGQSLEVMVIGCSDSRVSPEVIFDSRPGELFVVRNVANIVPPYDPDGHAHGVSAALEFGIAALKVKHIVVLGHAYCSGVKAYLRKRPIRCRRATSSVAGCGC